MMTATVLDPPATSAFLARAARILSGDVRPDDHLALSEAVRRGVDADVVAVPNPSAVAPEVMRRQTRLRLLAHHHGGQNVAYLETDAGVVVLAVGLCEVSDLLRAVPPAARTAVRLTVPEPFD